MSKFSSNPPAYVPTATPSSSYEYAPVNNASVVDSGKNTEAEVVYLAEGQVQVVPDLHTQVPVAVQGNSSTTSHPPPGCPDGGQWGKITYVGNNTSLLACALCLCFGPLGCCILACPNDEKDAYSVNGNIYDAGGKFLGRQGNVNFVPSRMIRTTTSPAMTRNIHCRNVK